MNRLIYTTTSVTAFCIFLINPTEPQFQWPTSSTTKAPGQSIQEALDYLSQQVEYLYANQQECRNCSRRLTRLEQDNYSILRRLQALEDLNAGIVDAINSLFLANATLTARMNNLESQLRTERGRISVVEEQIANTILPALDYLKAATDKFERVNQIWKKNFKIINETFQKLRQKVTFKFTPFRTY